MIKVTVGNRILGIAFSHPSKQEKVGEDIVRVLRGGRVAQLGVVDMAPVKYTICGIYEILKEVDMRGKELTTLLAEGVARCSPLDNFCKETGRKRALARALATHVAPDTRLFPFDDREAIWFAYLDRPRTTPPKKEQKLLNAAPPEVVAAVTIH